MEREAIFRPRSLPDRPKNGAVLEVGAPTVKRTWPPGVVFAQVRFVKGRLEYKELPEPPSDKGYRTITAPAAD